jgi:hypothetical protein
MVCIMVCIVDCMGHGHVLLKRPSRLNDGCPLRKADDTIVLLMSWRDTRLSCLLLTGLVLHHQHLRRSKSEQPLSSSDVQPEV